MRCNDNTIQFSADETAWSENSPCVRHCGQESDICPDLSCQNSVGSWVLPGETEVCKGCASRASRAMLDVPAQEVCHCPGCVHEADRAQCCVILLCSLQDIVCGVGERSVPTDQTTASCENDIDMSFERTCVRCNQWTSERHCKKMSCPWPGVSHLPAPILVR